MRIRVLLFLISVLLPSGRALAQATTYPVQVNANILPPYSLYLSDYYSGTREKLAVTLINRDQLKPTLNVRLRMIITAPGGLRIQTNDNTYIPPIQVENGIPLRLTRDDLEPYFQPNALITSGYLTDGRLPEGMIEFCFQAIEAYTGQVLSTSTCARAFITSQKPPLLSLPQNNESVPFRDPLNLLFQWTPRHQGVAFVEYDVIIKELWDNGMTPQAAFSYSPEIFRETTRSTSMLYGAMQPPLLPGKRYAWCVRAQAREGMDAINVFQNDGYSEIRTFTLQSDCAAPELVKATAERTRLNVSWDPLPQHIGFTVSYRLKDGDTVGEWQEKQTLEPEVQITGLKMAGTYEYRIGSYCVAGQPVYSPILSITLPKKDTARLAQCGFMPEVNLANQEPIKTLNTGDIFMANDYPVTITRISGSDGVFSGEGWTEVPWLADVKLAVQYTSIKINTDKQLIDGYIDAKYDKTEGQIADLDDVFEGGQDVGNVKTGLTRVDYAVDFSIPGVESFSVNDDGNLVIKDSDGDANVVTPKDLEGTGNEGNKVMVFPMTVKDKDGVVYQVVATETDEQGKATAVKATKIAKQGTKLAADSFNPTQLNGDKAIVTFIKGAGKYPFDTWKDYYAGISLIKSNYEKLYNDYYAPWKFLTVGQGDVVSARISIKDNVVKPENVIFKTPAGIEYDATYTDGVYTLQIASGPAGDVQELYALYPDPSAKEKYWTLGKLGIATYATQSYKLVLVPVEDAPVDVEDIRTMLKTVYDSIGVTWQVELAPSLSYKEDKLMANSTGLSTYNDAMRNLNAAYKDAVQAAGGRFDEAANYLFFLKATGADKTNERDYTGFMPRGAQFGYIFTSELRRKQIPQVVAHELGHGRWKLFHPFDSHYGSVTAAEKTDNLMSYGENAGSFAKWQWDIVNDPAMLVSVFEKDEKSGSYRFVLKEGFLNKDRKTVSFVTYDGSILTVDKSRLVSVTLNYGTMQFDATARQVPGVLQKFELEEDGKNVTYEIEISNGVYATSLGVQYVEPSVKDEDIDGVIMGLPCGKDFTIYKFEKTGLSRYTGKLLPNPVKDVIDFPLRPFAKHAALKSEGKVITQTLSAVFNCYYCMDESTASMTLPFCQSPEILYVTKLAEFRAAYPGDFQDFTYTGDAWANPSMEQSEDVKAALNDGSLGKYYYKFWPQYLKDNPKLKTNFEANVEKELFFKTMYVQLLAFLQKRVEKSADFWKNLTMATPSADVVRETNLLAAPELEVLDFEKRKIAIQILMKGLVPQTKETSLVSLIGVIRPEQQAKMLKFLADDIKIKTVFDKFDDFMGDDNFTRVVTLMSSFIEEPAINEASISRALSESIVTLDLDIIGNKQTHGYSIDDENNILFYNNVRVPVGDGRGTIEQTDYILKVPYDQRIPVYFASSFDLVGNKAYGKGHAGVELPAMYIALMLDKGNKELFAKKAWLAVDGVMLVIGVGEAKAAFRTASWLHKLAISSSLVGSAGGIVVESLPSSVISDQWRTRLRILSAIMNAPEAVRTVRNIARQTVWDLRMAKASTNVASEQKAIEDVASAYEGRYLTAEDIVEDAGNYVKTFGDGNDLKQVSGWIGQIKDDKRVYIAVHGNGSEFSVVHNGVTHTLSHRSLARWLESNPDLLGNKDIVLLTCADSKAAQNLANKLSGTNRIISWDGAVEVYETGYINGKGVCYSYTKSNDAGLKGTIVSASEVPRGKAGVEMKGAKVVLGVANDASAFAQYGKLIARLDVLGVTVKNRFFSDFADASTEVLKRFDDDITLIDGWKAISDKGLFRPKYIDVKLGKRLGQGGKKFSYVAADDPSIAVLKMKKDGQDPKDLIEEIGYLIDAKKAGLPVVEFDGMSMHDGTFSMIMDYYAGGSLKLLDETPSTLNINTLEDLAAIKKKLLNDGLYVGDIQFLVDADGKVFLADPMDFKIDPDGARYIVETQVDYLFSESMVSLLKKKLEKDVIYTKSDLLSALENVVDEKLFDQMMLKFSQLPIANPIQYNNGVYKILK